MGIYVGRTSTYTPVEYIESTGTQWIDTGVNALDNELELKFQYTDLSNTTYVCGSSDGTNRFGLIANRTANNDICYGDKSNNYYTMGTADTQIHIVSYNNSSNQVVYDSVVKGTLPNLTNQVAKPFGLFALSGTSGAVNSASVRIMYCRITDKSTNTLIRNFIPVINQDNVACMYEQVEGVFYYNAGSGAFIAGSTTGQPVSIGDKAKKVKKMYAGITSTYTPVEYIEGNGYQAIDTGFCANQNTRVEMQFMPTSLINISGIYSFLLCGRSGYHTNEFSLFVNAINWWIGYGSSDTQQANPTPTANTIYTIDKNKNVTTINGTSYTQSTATFQSPVTMKIFSAEGGQSDHVSGRLYYVKIYDNGTMVRNMIPVVDENGRAGLLDQIDGKIYYSSTFYDFEAGSATGDPNIVIQNRARKVKTAYVGTNTTLYTPIEYLESSGTQYIDTRVVPKSTTRMVVEMQYPSATHDTIGWGSSGGLEAFACGSGDSSTTFAMWCSANFTMVDTNVAFDNAKHTFDMSNTAMKFDGTTYGTGTIGNTAECWQTIGLFGIHAEWEVNPVCSPMRIYSCKIYDGDTLIRDYIPVLDKNNVACFYEKVSNTFWHNERTGTFTAGTSQTAVDEDVARLTSPQVVKYGYIDAYGTVYFMPEIYVTNEDKIEVEFMVTATRTHSYSCYWLQSSGSNYYVKLLAKPNTLYWTFGTSTGSRTIGISRSVKYNAVLTNGRIQVFSGGSSYQVDTMRKYYWNTNRQSMVFRCKPNHIRHAFEAWKS